MENNSSYFSQLQYFEGVVKEAGLVEGTDLNLSPKTFAHGDRIEFCPEGYCYLDRYDIPSSSPLRLRGYMCPSIRRLVMETDWVYSHSSWGTGFIQMTFS